MTTCVCCGAEVPEGRQVCPRCEKEASKKKAPCQDCERRTPICHIRCEDYRKWKTAFESFSEKKRKIAQREGDYIGCKVNLATKMKKKKK